jgi:hypothetical protein
MKHPLTARISSETEAAPASFVHAPLHFQQPRDLQSEVLLDGVREILRLAESSERWDETTELLESLLDWLRFRLEQEKQRLSQSD